MPRRRLGRLPQSRSDQELRFVASRRTNVPDVERAAGEVVDAFGSRASALAAGDGGCPSLLLASPSPSSSASNADVPLGVFQVKLERQRAERGTMTESGKRVAIVTGANGTIGRAISAGMASRGHTVVMVCRNPERAKQTVRGVQQDVPDADLRTEIVDLSRRGDIEAFAQAWRGPLHVLINNAAIAPRLRSETPLGIELEFATNVLGYVWMMRAFEGVLRRSAPARVVNVASYWAGDLDLGDLEFRRRAYDNDTAYRQSKQANRMLTVAFANRWDPSEITANSCHPGDANSALSNSLGYGGHETAEEAAATPVWLATDASVAGVTGRYFAGCRERACEFASDARAIAALDAICAKY
jgi:retinol dehydrogenase 12